VGVLLLVFTRQEFALTEESCAIANGRDGKMEDKHREVQARYVGASGCLNSAGSSAEGVAEDAMLYVSVCLLWGRV
jgi:hypothetical protein